MMIIFRIFSQNRGPCQDSGFHSGNVQPRFKSVGLYRRRPGISLLGLA